MHPKYRNQGYMQESVRLATQYICDTKLTNELHTEVDVNNIASRKVLERCGYSTYDVVNNNSETYMYQIGVTDECAISYFEGKTNKNR